MSTIYAEPSSLSARLDGIGHILRDLRLAVPQYQRSYAWQEEQVSTFWSDLRTAFSTREPGYFLGTIVLAKSEDDRFATIIDGQQRLATAALLLAAIRQQFATHGDEERAAAFGQEYLSYYNLGAGKRQPRLELNKQDREAFSAIALGTDFPTVSAASTRRLRDAYDYLREQVSNEVDQSDKNWTTHLARWADFIENKVRVIVVTVPTSGDAFLVFETLNDRGIALTVADLLKNYLFGISEDKLQVVDRNWETMLETLEAADNEQRLLEFLRHYWSSMYGATRERDLYRSFRSRVRSQERSIELAQRLAEASNNYMALVTGDVARWPSGSVTQMEVDTLRTIRITQNWPMLLAAIECFNPTELVELVRSTIRWGIRGIIAGGIGGGTAERVYCEAAVRIRAGDITNVAEVLKVLQPVIATDEDFRAASEAISAPNARITRYLLLALDQFSSQSKSPFLVSSSELDQCVAQRVLPVSPTTNWPYFADDEVATWAKRLGNFIPLEAGKSNRSADRSWIDIRERLPESKFESNHSLSAIDNWSPDIIRDRQAGMAEAFVTIWPREA